jgi:hypothetical protein
VRLYEVIDDFEGGRVLMVMEYCEAGSLVPPGTLSPERTLPEAMAQVRGPRCNGADAGGVGMMVQAGQWELLAHGPEHVAAITFWCQLVCCCSIISNR